MKNKLIDAIRDLAIQYEAVDMEGALELMGVALRHRPNGAVIAAKVREYQAALGHLDEDRSVLRALLTERKLAVVPIGFRCHTAMELKKRFGIQQPSLPFDSGFFPPQAIARVLKNPRVALKYQDGGSTHGVCLKREAYIDPVHGLGIKFETKTYDYIDSSVKSLRGSDINQYLDTTFGYYTLDKKFDFVLAHYNWHPLATRKNALRIFDPEVNLEYINNLLNKRIERMLEICHAAEHVVFVYFENQGYNHMQIDDRFYSLFDFSDLEEACEERFGKKYSILNISDLESPKDLILLCSSNEQN